MSSRLLLTVHTARHLRPNQIAGRLRRTVRTLTGGPSIRSPDPAPELHPRLARLGSAIRARANQAEHEASLRRAAILRDGNFQAVGETLPVDQIDWNAQLHSPLFTYHLHYFDDAPFLATLAAEGDHEAAARLFGLLSDWHRTAQPGAGVGWDPYPTSARIPRWIQALGVLSGLPESVTDWGARERDALTSSLWSQADLLARTLEVDLQGNHLLRNRMALVWAAAALRPHPVPLDRAMRELSAEFDRQILPDGMHEERTPAYHALALYDLLELMELFEALGLECPSSWPAHARRMLHVLDRFVRDDGGLHPFGDTTPHGHPTPAMIRALARRVGELANGRPQIHVDPAPRGPWHLPDAGFMGVRTSELDVVLDCGPFGAPHQPGHGHCDGLSFVLSVGGVPVVVDPGIAGYEGNPHRFWARSTAAHNTVQIEGLEQTEIWDVFRAARRARPGPASISEHDSAFVLNGAVSPWHSRALTHRRTLRVHPTTNVVEVTDTLRGARGRRIDTRIHLSPEASLEPVATQGDSSQAESGYRGRWIVHAGSFQVRIDSFGLDGSSPEEALVFPGWERTEPAPVLRGWIHECRAEEASFGWRIRLHETAPRPEHEPAS